MGDLLYIQHIWLHGTGPPWTIVVAAAAAFRGHCACCCGPAHWLCAAPGTSTYSELWTLLAGAKSPMSMETLKSLDSRVSSVSKQLKSHAATRGAIFSIDNALFTNNTPVNLTYASKMNKYFKAKVASAASVADINAWAKKSTRGMIDKAMPDGTPFKMVIANAVYFLGSWWARAAASGRAT